MYQTITEADWVHEYVRNKTHLAQTPLPVVLGTNGTWTGNRKPMIILIAFTIVDVLMLADFYGVPHHPVREIKNNHLSYYAINIIDKKKVKDIIQDWKPKE